MDGRNIHLDAGRGGQTYPLGAGLCIGPQRENGIPDLLWPCLDGQVLQRPVDKSTCRRR